jgi:hypothetical protein
MIGGMPADQFNAMANQRRQSEALAADKLRPQMSQETIARLQGLKAQRDSNFTSNPAKQYGANWQKGVGEGFYNNLISGRAI